MHKTFVRTKGFPSSYKTLFAKIHFTIFVNVMFKKSRLCDGLFTAALVGNQHKSLSRCKSLWGKTQRFASGLMWKISSGEGCSLTNSFQALQLQSRANHICVFGGLRKGLQLFRFRSTKMLFFSVCVLVGWYNDDVQKCFRCSYEDISII